MAKVSMGKMKKDRKVADARSGGGLLKLKEGTTLLYVCPPVHDEDPIPYLEVRNCFGFGPNKKSVTDAEGLEDSKPFRDALEESGVDFDDARDGWEYAAKHEEFRTRWYFNVVPLAHRAGAGDEFETMPPVVMKLGVGKQVYDGITDVFFEEGDISDPDAAIFVKVTRKGSGLKTEYKVRTDSESLKSPVELDDNVWAEVGKVCIPGGQNDLHKWIAGQVRTKKQVLAVHEGEDSEDEEVDRRERKAKTTSKPASSRRKKKEPEPEEVDEDEEELDEEELDEDSEVEEDEEETPPPKKKPARKKKAAPVVEEDEEEDDDDDEEEEEEDDDEDGDDVDALEAALKARSKRGKKK